MRENFKVSTLQMEIKTCIIPAAGKGSRWAPVSGYLPKEMLPLIDKPVIEWVINDAIHSGCNNIVIVINKQKEAIKNYFKGNKNVNKRANINFVYQNEPLGISHALLLCKKLAGTEDFAVALPDLPTISKSPVIKQLVEVYKNNPNSHIISFDKFSTKTIHLYGECLVKSKKGRILEIEHFCQKTDDIKKPHHFGNTVRMSGKFIFKNSIFPLIESLLREKRDREISDRSALSAAIKNGQGVTGLKISGHTYDTGFPEGYVRANTAFFKKIITSL